MHSKVRVCMFAGHTGGHLFPAVAFAERFKIKFPQSDLCLITSSKASKIIDSLTNPLFDRVFYINEFPLFSFKPSVRLRPLSAKVFFYLKIPFRLLAFLLEFLRAFFVSSSLLKQANPQICIGFGSYVSYPGMKLAVWKKIPTIIHEQNKVAGKATQMLATQVKIVAMSFPQTVCREPRRHTVITGLPIRESLYRSGISFHRVFELPSPERPLTLLVTGGSQGAQGLNRVVLQTFSELNPEERKKIAVIHISGAKNFDWVNENYKKMDINYKVYPFYEKMQELYQAADFAVTRAGANTLFELALFRLPALAVPFPFAAENHQEINARFFESENALWVRKESDLTPLNMAETIRSAFVPEKRLQLSKELTKIATRDAAEELVDLAASELMIKENL